MAVSEVVCGSDARECGKVEGACAVIEGDCGWVWYDCGWLHVICGSLHGHCEWFAIQSSMVAGGCAVRTDINGCG